MAVFRSAPGGEADDIGAKADIGERSGGYDDLIVAVALAVWLGETASALPITSNRLFATRAGQA